MVLTSSDNYDAQQRRKATRDRSARNEQYGDGESDATEDEQQREEHARLGFLRQLELSPYIWWAG